MKKLNLFLTLVALSLATSSLWADVPAGAIPGMFSVSSSCSATNIVYFSQGNLQYNSNTQTWQFAAHQYSFIGNATGNTNITVDGKANNTGIADLFGWVGASSTWSGLKQYGLTSSSNANKKDGYGNVANDNLKSDWGTLMGSGWRTLTSQEWRYLFFERTGNQTSTVGGTPGVRYASAKVNGVGGIIIFPDGGTFTSEEFTTFNVSSLNSTFGGYSNITCDVTKWGALEAKGCVFLPAAGIRNGTTVSRAEGTDAGYYWSSTGVSSSAYSATEVSFFNCCDLNAGYAGDRYKGHSVRLVKNVPSSEKVASVTTPPTEAHDLVYTGSAQDLLTTAGEAQNGTMKYRLGTSGSFSTSIPSATAAGEYTVQYYAEGTGCFNNSATQSVNVTIAQADYTPSSSYSVTGNNVSYTGAAQALATLTGSVTDGTIYYKLGDGDWSDEIPTATAIGDYHVWYKVVPDDSNYKTTDPVEVVAHITVPTINDHSDAEDINEVFNLNPTNLKVERTIHADGAYNTICLPFNVTAEDLASSTYPLYGYERLKAFKGASVTGSGQALHIDIFVEDVDHMDAGVPYLITYPADREGGNIENPIFNGITVTTTEPDAVSANGVTFQGMFAQEHIAPYQDTREQDFLFLGANNELYWPEVGDASYMRGFRAYFIINRSVISVAHAPRGTRARIMDAPKTTTGIDELNATTCTKYIENGQLYIIKNGVKYNAQGIIVK